MREQQLLTNKGKNGWNFQPEKTPMGVKMQDGLEGDNTLGHFIFHFFKGLHPFLSFSFSSGYIFSQFFS